MYQVILTSKQGRRGYEKNGRNGLEIYSFGDFGRFARLR